MHLGSRLLGEGWRRNGPEDDAEGKHKAAEIEEAKVTHYSSPFDYRPSSRLALV
jgi:hypothetical protein